MRGKDVPAAAAAVWLGLAGAAMAQSNTTAPASGLSLPGPHETGAASANNPSATSETQPGRGIITGNGTTDSTGVSPEDRHFVQQAEQYAQAEIQAGRLVVSSSKSQKVQIFARQAIDTGETIIAPIQKIASSIGLQPVTDFTKAEDEVRQLKAAEGTVMDGLYGDLEARDQRDLIALYDKEAKDGANGRLKSFAATERQHADVMLHNAQLLKIGTIDHVDPNCPYGGPAKAGCP